ncbi:MAG: hypothetical protein AAB267_03990 [Candidatus Desantisbacteria bacterium]
MVVVSISLGLLGLAVGLLGILCIYVWKGNHKLEKALLDGQRILGMWFTVQRFLVAIRRERR